MFPFQSSHSGDKMLKLKSSQKDRCREFITLTQTGENYLFKKQCFPTRLLLVVVDIVQVGASEAVLATDNK